MQLKKHMKRTLRRQWERVNQEQKSEMLELFGSKFLEKKENKKRVRERRERKHEE
jgi:hypothetical protein